MAEEILLIFNALPCTASNYRKSAEEKTIIGLKENPTTLQ